MRILGWLALLVVLASPARADELSHLSGRVSDRAHDIPVEGALVYVSGAGGLAHTLTTDAAGRYAVRIAPGTYHLIFAFGPSRTSGKVVVGAGAARLDGVVDSLEGEVIEIQGRINPPVPPKPKNFSVQKAPPYSDRAVLTDAWTKAWMLLDISETGKVTRFKWLQRPGYDLEQIAVAEVFKLAFEPARDAAGKPMATWMVWSIEWPSAWWLEKFVGTRSGMPPLVGFPPRRKDHYVPCKGSGPLNLSSLHPTYKDCSQPDLTKASTEAWIGPAATPRKR